MASIVSLPKVLLHTEIRVTRYACYFPNVLNPILDVDLFRKRLIYIQDKSDPLLLHIKGIIPRKDLSFAFNSVSLSLNNTAEITLQECLLEY